MKPFTEQIIILVSLALLLISGLGWGLPDQRRTDLLLHGLDMTPAEAAKHFAASKAKTGLSEQLSRRWELTDWDKYQNLCEFALYSSAADEWFIYDLLSRMNPAALDLRPYRQVYGGAFYYPVGVLLFIGKKLNLIQVGSGAGYYLAHPEAMARIIMVGRSLPLLAFLGTGLILVLWGNAWQGRGAGTMALISWGLCPVALSNALITKPHAYAAFFGALGIFLLWRYVRVQGRVGLVASAAATGWAIGSSVVCAPLMVFYPIMLWRSGLSMVWLRRCLLCGLVALLVWALTNPYSILDFPTFWKELNRHSGELDSARFLVFTMHKLVFGLENLFLRMTAFPLGFMGAGWLAWALLRGDRLQASYALGLLLLILALLPTLGIGRVTTYVMPLFCLATGLGLALLWNYAGDKWKRLGRYALLVLFLPGFINMVLYQKDVYNWDAWYPPTKEWVDEAWRKGPTSVGVLGYHLSPVIYPPWPFMNAKVFNLQNYEPEKQLPDYVIVGHWGGLLEKWPKHPLYGRYKPIHNLGMQEDWAWLPRFRYQAETWLGAKVYALQTPR